MKKREVEREKESRETEKTKRTKKRKKDRRTLRDAGLVAGVRARDVLLVDLDVLDGVLEDTELDSRGIQ